MWALPGSALLSPASPISGHLLLYGIPPLRNLIFLPTRHALTQRANTSHCLQHIRHAVSGLSCDSFHLRKSASARAAIIYLLARPDQASCRLCTLHRHSVVHVLDLGFPAPDKHANSPITTRVRIATACNSTNSVVFFFISGLSRMRRRATLHFVLMCRRRCLVCVVSVASRPPPPSHVVAAASNFPRGSADCSYWRVADRALRILQLALGPYT